MRKNYLAHTTILFYFLLSITNTTGQTNPTAQTLPYSQNFSALTSGSAIYPVGWQAWNLGNGSLSTFLLTAGISDFAMTAPSDASFTNGGAHNYNGAIGFLAEGTSPAGTANPALVLAINTTGKFNVLVNYSIMTIRNAFNASTNNRINQSDLQYRIGTSGNFISIGGTALYQNNNTTQITGTVPQNSLSKSITLPAACNNQAVVQLRWVQRILAGTVGSLWPSFAIDNVSICPSIVTPTISIAGPTTFCSGTQLTYTASISNGGTVPSYQWKKNGTSVGIDNSTLSINGLVTGDQISCTLTSNATCASAATVNSNVISPTVNSSPTITLNSITNDNTCAAGFNGAISISVAGGSPPYNVVWDTVNTTNIFIVSVGAETAANPNPPSIGADFYVDGVETKELTLTRGFQYSFNVSGGHPFHISTQLIGGNTAGIVTNGQTGAPTGGGIVTFKPDNTHPSLLYYPCGAHAYMGYKINIINGYVTQNPVNLKPGTYMVSVTDASGCTATASYTVGLQPGSLTLSANVTDATCSAHNGSIDLQPSGGAGPYTACWDTINKANGGVFGVTVGNQTYGSPYYGYGNGLTYYTNGVEAAELKLVRGIPYSFNIMTSGHPWFITTDNIGGTGSSVGIVTGQTNAPTDLGTVTFTPSVSHPALLNYVCNNHPYMGYRIQISNAYCIEDPSNLAPGIYTVKVTDAGGCTATGSYTVGSAGSNLSLTASVTDAACGLNNGSIDLQPSGGTAPYTACWDTMNKANGTLFGVTVGTQTNASPYYGYGSGYSFYTNGVEGAELKLVRGIDYSFSVMAYGHSWFISTDYVGGTGALTGFVNGQSNAPTDYGTVTFTPTASHPSLLNYVCDIHQYMGYQIQISDAYCIEDPTNLTPGIYSVKVTDAAGCSVAGSYTVGSLQGNLSLNASVTDAACGLNNGAIDLQPSGGVGPYTACWDTINKANGGIFGVTVGTQTNANPYYGLGNGLAFYTDGVEAAELNLVRGIDYSFNIMTYGHPWFISTDNIGGTGYSVGMVSGQTNAPTDYGTVTFTPDASHPSLLNYVCNNHQYMGYQIQISDAYCIEDLSNLSPGIYTVKVTDAGGCTATSTYTINQTPGLNLSANIQNVACGKDGSIDLNIDGGTPPYSVCWDTTNTNGTQFSVTFGPKTAAHPLFGQGSANGYIIDGIEGKSMSLTRGIPYSFNVLTPNHPFRITTDLIGGTTNNVVSGGQTGAPTVNGTVSFTPDMTHPNLLYYSCQFHQYMGYNVNINNGYCVEDLSGLTSGVYSVIVSDANGCTATAQYTVTDAIPLSVSANVTDLTCSAKGSIDLSVSGGTPPYSICWDTTNTNGTQFAVTFGPKTAAHPLFGQGSANGYIIDGVEGKNMSLTRGIPYSFNVLTPNHPFRITTDLAGGTVNNVVSSGQTGAPTVNGTVFFTPNSTHPSLLYYSCQFHQFMGYNVQINNGYCVEDLSGLNSGVYSVIVSDANGCTFTTQYFVNPYTPISVSSVTTDASCSSSHNGAIDLTVSGGNGPYTVCWDTVNTSGSQFLVTSGAKNATHPLFGQGSTNGYIINGIQGKEVVLTRNIQYDFNVFAANHPFRITTDLAGGTANNVVTNGQTGAPTQNGVVSFKPDNTHPNLLYYSCQFHQFMGYNVKISNGYCIEDLSNVNPGTYSASVTDANGCNTVTTVVVNQAPTGTEICGNGIDDDCDGSIDEGCATNLSVKLYIEGFYIGGGQLNAAVDPNTYPNLCDTVKISLASAISPYNILYTSKGTINISGAGVFTFPSVPAGTSYYIVARHRNTLETWSSVPLLFGAINSYDFTTAASKAFGNNMTETFDHLGWCLFSGDVSDAATGQVGVQDKIIEAQDYLDMENAVGIILVGYTPTDITGDGVVEAADYLIMENNVNAIRFTMGP